MPSIQPAAEDLLERVRARALGSAPSAAHRVFLRQRGEIRLKGDRWAPFEARQTIEVARPGFCWRARVRMAPFVGVCVRDAFENGRGRLDARLWGVLPVARARGARIDAAELQRYLSELPWCPFAYVGGEDLAFARVGEDVLRVGVPAVGAGAVVDLEVDAAGDVTCARSEARWRQEGKTMVERPWSGRFEGHEERGGVRIPTRCVVRWHLPGGEEAYFRGAITAYRVV